jgi:hypothetical protein
MPLKLPGNEIKSGSANKKEVHSQMVCQRLSSDITYIINDFYAVNLCF